jgi:hypothetical protein
VHARQRTRGSKWVGRGMAEDWERRKEAQCRACDVLVQTGLGVSSTSRFKCEGKEQASQTNERNTLQPAVPHESTLMQETTAVRDAAVSADSV